VQELNQVETFRNYLKSRSERTADAYARDAQRFLDFIQKKPDKVTALDVSAWFQELRKNGYAERSICRASWSLRKFFKLIGRGEVAEFIEVPMYVAKEAAWLPKDDIDRLLRAAEGPAELYLATAYDLALRVGELNLLRREFFNPETRQIKVYRLKHKGRPNEYILEVSEPTARMLEKYLKTRTDRNPRIFPVCINLVTYYYRKTAHAAGIDPYEYTFHCLRHSRITHIAIDMLQKEGHVDEVRLAKFAGHFRYETTLLYVHLASEYLVFKK
jgi:integrase